MRIQTTTFVFALAAAAALAPAAQYELLTGVNTRKYPGTATSVFVTPPPSTPPGIPGTFRDGDRLAGTADDGTTVNWQGSGTPVYLPNHVGSTSFLFRRGSVPAGVQQICFMGIDFLGGPLLDLDGDLNNNARSLTPITNVTAVEIPGSFSHIDLSFDLTAGTVSLVNFDATGTNEGGPGVTPLNGITVITLAGTQPNGTLAAPPNPFFDTRLGTVTQHVGPGGPVPGVYRITGLNAELWYDSINPGSSSPGVLGTMQELCKFRGWLIRRDCATGQFPTLAGQNLGGTIWPAIDTAEINQTYNTASGLTGGSATILDGVQDGGGNPTDLYSAHPNGLALAGGDLGAYFDTVISPLAVGAKEYVYLESAGFGINNSFDPVFTDTNGYDAVFIAMRRDAAGDLSGDGAVNLTDLPLFLAAVLDPQAQTPAAFDAADVNGDCQVNGLDIAPFTAAIVP